MFEKVDYCSSHITRISMFMIFLNCFIWLKYYLFKQGIRTCHGFREPLNNYANRMSAHLSLNWQSNDRNIDNVKIVSHVSEQSSDKEQDYGYYDSIRGIRSYSKNKNQNKQKNKKQQNSKQKNKNKKNRLIKQLTIDMKHPLTPVDFKRAKLLTVEDYFINNRKILFNDIIKEKTGRTAIRDQSKLWPSGYVSYVISHKYPPLERARIAKAFDEFQEKTCIKFIPKQKETKNYIRIASVEGCSSRVGMSDDYFEHLRGYTGSQLVDLKSGTDCIKVGVIIHELMHAIGFDHEQNRPDRDDYIKILWNNVPEQFKNVFKKLDSSEFQTLDEPYDFNSIMHYELRYKEKEFMAPLKPLQPVLY